MNTRDFWVFSLVYDNEEGGEGEGEGESEGEGGENKQETKQETKQEQKKVFDQEQVNKILAEDRRKNQKQRDGLISELKALRESSQLTDVQKEQLETRIEQLQNETLTVQELAKKDKEKLSKEFDKEKTKIVGERDFWRSAYSEEKILRELQDAASEHKAISPQQIMNMLKPNTKLVEELKDGKPTGRWVTKTTLVDHDDKGERLTLELSATEAVKRMSEMPEHWNLFNSGAIGGTGGFNMGQNGGTGYRGKKPPKDPAEYKKWREVNIGK